MTFNRSLAEPTPEAFPNRLSCYLSATRPPFLSVTFVGCFVGLACAYGSGVMFNASTAAVTILLALLAHASANVINDYHDALNGADEVNIKRIFPFTGGSRFIQNGVLTPQQTARLGYGLFAIIIPAGLWLTWQAGAGLILIGLFGLLCAWAYSAPPLFLASRGLGEIAITVGWMLIVIGADYVQRGHFSLVPCAASVSYALLVANVLYINQFPDYEGDQLAGKKTVVVRFGPEVAKWGYLLIALIAYTWLILITNDSILPHHCAAAAITLVFSFSAARELIAYATTPSKLHKAIIQTIIAVNLHGLLLSATLLFGRWPQ